MAEEKERMFKFASSLLGTTIQDGNMKKKVIGQYIVVMLYNITYSRTFYIFFVLYVISHHTLCLSPK